MGRIDIPWNRENILPLAQQPRQRQLSRRAILLIRNRLQFIHQHQILREILVRKPRRRLPPVALLKIPIRLILPGQHATTQWRIRDDCDAELATRLEQVDLWGFDIECKGGVFDLDGGDGVNGVGAAEGCG